MSDLLHAPPRYLEDVASQLEAAEPELWAWFRSDQFQDSYRTTTANDLLRTAVRLEPIGPNDRRYQLADQAKTALGVSVPLSLHQSLERSGSPNAALVFAPEEVRIVFQGRILELFANEAELLDLLGHEISHHKLLTIEDGRYHTLDRLLRWVGRREDCPPEYLETWRRTSLFTEIYCDIGGLVACGDRDATISGLVKVLSDFRDADATSYLAQAQQLLATGPGATRGMTHPELHVRVLAIANAHLTPDAFEALIQPLVMGPIELGGLDVADQAVLLTSSRALLARALALDGTAHEVATAHARQLFPGLTPDPSALLAPPANARTLGTSAQDYLGYLLLDLVTCDRTHAHAALRGCVGLADEAGIGQRFREIARLELKAERDLLAALPRRIAA